MSQCHWEGATVLPWCPQKGKKMLRDELEELKEHPEGLNTTDWSVYLLRPDGADRNLIAMA